MAGRLPNHLNQIIDSYVIDQIGSAHADQDETMAKSTGGGHGQWSKDDVWNVHIDGDDQGTLLIDAYSRYDRHEYYK